MRARTGFSREQHEFAQSRWDQSSAFEWGETGFCDADDLVLEKGIEFDPFVGADGADERQLDAAGEQPFQDFVAGRDLDLDAIRDRPEIAELLAG